MCTECGMNAPSCYSIVGRVPARCCSNCTHADAQELYAELLPLRSRAPLVEEVIRLANLYRNVENSGPTRARIRFELAAAAVKLAEWKP